MEKIKLEYGMIVEMEDNPISYAFAGIGITSSTTPKEKVTFVVSKYNDTDIDANRYKVTLIPTAEFRMRFGNNNFYSYDLRMLIEKGIAVIIK